MLQFFSPENLFFRCFLKSLRDCEQTGRSWVDSSSIKRRETKMARIWMENLAVTTLTLCRLQRAALGHIGVGVQCCDAFRCRTSHSASRPCHQIHINTGFLIHLHSDARKPDVVFSSVYWTHTFGRVICPNCKNKIRKEEAFGLIFNLVSPATQQLFISDERHENNIQSRGFRIVVGYVKVLRY